MIKFGLNIVLPALLIGVAAQAQLNVVPAPADTSGLMTRSEAQASIATINNSIAAVAAQVPQPADVVPPTEVVGGASGSQPTYRRGDAAQPRITRAGVASTTDLAGNWTITWSSALTGVPVVLPIPVNSTGEPVVCNVITRTTTGATGRCWYARTLPSTLTVLSGLVSYDVFGTAANGISVQVLAIPPTQ